MSNCAKNCKRDKIGHWYQSVKQNLSTKHYYITKSKFDKHNSKSKGKGNGNGSGKRISKAETEIFDIRNRTGIDTTPKFDSIDELTNIRILAENNLHQLYLKSAKACQLGSCSKYPITSLYLTFKYTNDNWQLVCEQDELNVGLCGNPIIHYASSQLAGAIKEALLLHENSCCLAIHLSLTFISNFNRSSHANTLLINPNCKTISHFEPQGQLINFTLPAIHNLQATLKRSLKEISKKILIIIMDI